MQVFTSDGKTVQLFASVLPGQPLLLLNTFAEAAEPLCLALQAAPDYTLVLVSGMDWEADLSPWPAEALGKHSRPFAGAGLAYLRWLEQTLLPQVEALLPAPPCWRGLAGYSLAGLFAVYALYHSTAFARVASMSGSLWFPGFCDFALTTPLAMQPQRVVLSLGDRERRTRHPLMRSVQDSTEALAAHYRALGVTTHFSLEPGGHFQDTIARTARGMLQLLAPEGR